MRYMILFCAVCMATSFPVAAQVGGSIGVYADPGGEDCHPRDIEPGLLLVYVVNKDLEGATAAQFAVETGDGFQGVYLGEAVVDPGDIVVGNVPTGVSVAYGECISAPIHVLTISYFVQGTSDDCCYFQVVGHPRYDGELLVADCSFQTLPAVGLKTFVNPDGNCECPSGSPTPTQNSSWGSIKALYAAK